MSGQEAVQSVNGPMTRTITDLELYSKSVVDRQTWLHDPRCVPIPWRTIELPAKLRIAVMWDDGMVRPTPPVARALKQTVEKLRAAGVEVVDWDPVDQKQGLSLLARMFVADGGISIKNVLKKTGEPMRPEMEAYETATELGTYDMWQLHMERTAFQKRYLDRWNAAGIDAILCPTTPFTSVKNGTYRHGKLHTPPDLLSSQFQPYIKFLARMLILTSQLDTLAYITFSTMPVSLSPPACQPTSSWMCPLPPRKSLWDLIARLSTLNVRSSSSKYEMNLADYCIDDPRDVHGMPISLQLVARRLEEEKAITLVKHVLDII